MSLHLAPSSFFTLPDDGRMRYARFTPAGTPRGVVWVVPGRREFIEKKYAELGAELLAKDLTLIIVEPRSQGLSSRFLSGDAAQRDHVTDFVTLLSDLRLFFAGVVQPSLTAPLIVHGHSLGAHLLLRWLAEDKPAVAGAFFTSPMLALAGMPAHLATYAISWIGARLLGHTTDYAPMQHDFNASDCTFSTNPLTQDPARFQLMEDYFRAFPELVVGGVTWGWLLASLRSMHITHERHYLARIEAPVLAILGGQDAVTPPSETGSYLNAIPRVRTHLIPAAKHDVLNETAVIRAEAWGVIEGFMKAIGH